MTRSATVRNAILLALACLAPIAGCSTAPKADERSAVLADSRSTLSWFERRVSGLDAQLAKSGGYVAFPGVGQYGIIIGGGKFGRGVAYTLEGRQIGWAYVNTVSAGLQLGGQGYKMLIVFEDPATMGRFKQNKLSGTIGATAVLAEEGAATTSSFTDGVAVYQGGQTGLMAGASIGLEYIRYEDLNAGS